MTMYGANPDQLDALAARFDSAAEMLRRGARLLTAQLTSNPWEGTKATRFRSDWNRSHRPSLIATAAGLSDAATRLRRNASDQRAASAATTGTARSIGGVGRSPYETRAMANVSAESLKRARELFDRALSLAGSAVFLQWAAKNRSVLGNLEASARHVFHVSEGARTTFVSLRTFGTSLSAVGTGLDGWDFARALGRNDSDTAIRKAISLGFDVGGAAIPVVGEMKAAWDVGYLGGTVLSAGQEHFLHTQENTVNWAAATYGTADIGNRYAGWSGFGRWATDGLRIRRT